MYKEMKNLSDELKALYRKFSPGRRSYNEKKTSKEKG